jgi:hypothetical protein
MRDGRPALVRSPEFDFVDDGAGKPVGIQMHIGRLERGLDEAQARHWTVVSMKDDWRRVFAFGAE